MKYFFFFTGHLFFHDFHYYLGFYGFLSDKKEENGKIVMITKEIAKM